MRTIYTLFLILFSQTLLIAQVRQVSGFIINTKTGEGIPFASISFLYPSNIQTVNSENEGRFKADNFPISEKLCQLKIEHPDFKTEITTNLNIGTNGNIATIKMTPKIESVGVSFIVVGDDNQAIKNAYLKSGKNGEIDIPIPTDGRIFYKIENDFIGNDIIFQVFTKDDKYFDFIDTIKIKGFHIRAITLKKKVVIETKDLKTNNENLTNPEEIIINVGRDEYYSLTQSQKKAVKETKLIMKNIAIAEYETEKSDFTEVYKLIKGSDILSFMYEESKVNFISEKIVQRNETDSLKISILVNFIDELKSNPILKSNPESKIKYDDLKNAVIKELTKTIDLYLN